MPVEGLVFDVQRFSVRDGPGIRTTVFFKGCALKCAWCDNPESMVGQVELAWLPERCADTGACRFTCPHGVLDDLPERIHHEDCNRCGLCITECPHHALRLVGQWLTLDELMDLIVRDRPFFESSGGGVTLSGGEPTQQMDFVALLAKECVDEGISVGLQTCGAFAWDEVVPHLGLFKFIHFDIKLIDPSEHRRLTGVNNRVILENASKMIAWGYPVLFRTPIIPGTNDSEDALNALATFLGAIGAQRVQLMQFHASGEAKLARGGFPITPLVFGESVHTAEAIEGAATFLRARGLEVWR